MRKRLAALFLFLIIIFAGFASPALAGTGEINFVETVVELSPDGTGVVSYAIQWHVLSGELHGFYFQPSEPITIFSEDSFASDSSGRRYALDVSDVASDKLDIILADGQGVSSGDVTYEFWYGTDFAGAGYVAPT